MNRPSADQEAPAATPGVVTKTALRIIDAGIHLLQRVRSRFAPTEDADQHGDKRSQSDSKHAPATEEPPPAPKPSFLRLALVALIFLLVGGGAGALLSYRALSHQLAEHANVVDRIQEDLDATRKEDARNVKLMDKFQRENAEYRHEAREAQRETELANHRISELEEKIELMKRAAPPAQQPTPRPTATTPHAASRATPRATPSTPQKTGNCTVGNTNDLSECIEHFNR